MAEVRTGVEDFQFKIRGTFSGFFWQTDREHDQSMFYWKIVSACQMSEGFLPRVHQYFDRRKQNANLIFIFIGEKSKTNTEE